MSVRITYFVHGSTADNIHGISSGWYDAELSDIGMMQSVNLRKDIENIKFDAVFSSDLKRAVDSAKLMFQNTIHIGIDSRLRECNYGIYNAQPSTVVEPMQEKCIEDRFPEGESYKDVESRISDFLQVVKERHDGKHVAIVAHKAPQLALDVLLKGKTWEQAINEDWRKTKAWQPGWEYELK